MLVNTPASWSTHLLRTCLGTLSGLAALLTLISLRMDFVWCCSRTSVDSSSAGPKRGTTSSLWVLKQAKTGLGNWAEWCHHQGMRWWSCSLSVPWCHSTFCGSCWCWRSSQCSTTTTNNKLVNKVLSRWKFILSLFDHGHPHQNTHFLNQNLWCQRRLLSALPLNCCLTLSDGLKEEKWESGGEDGEDKIMKEGQRRGQKTRETRSSES